MTARGRIAAVRSPSQPGLKYRWPNDTNVILDCAIETIKRLRKELKPHEDYMAALAEQELVSPAKKPVEEVVVLMELRPLVPKPITRCSCVFQARGEYCGICD